MLFKIFYDLSILILNLFFIRTHKKKRAKEEFFLGCRLTKEKLGFSLYFMHEKIKNGAFAGHGGAHL